MKNKFIKLYMRMAEEAANLSYCNRSKVGTIIVKGNKIYFGYNGTPPGAPNVCEGPDGQTLPSVIHSEENAIRKLQEDNESGSGAIMFVTLMPCLSCAEKIVQAGIRTVYYQDTYRDLSGLHYLIEKGVRVVRYPA